MKIETPSEPCDSLPCLEGAACERCHYTAVEGREAPRRYLPWANAGGPNECQHGYAAGIPCPSCDATVEACARAAYEARYADSLHLRRPLAEQDEPTREMWREVARVVLAAAGPARYPGWPDGEAVAYPDGRWELHQDGTAWTDDACAAPSQVAAMAAAEDQLRAFGVLR